MTKKQGPTDHRDSRTGQFETPQRAKQHPASSEAEHNRKPAAPPPKKGR